MIRKSMPVFLAGWLLLSVSGSQAEGWLTCAHYARAAVDAAKEVRTRSCGTNKDNPNALDLNNPQWSLDYKAHERWCLASNAESVDWEREQRKEKLAACQRCDDYSTTAVRTAELVGRESCGYEGPMWSTSRNDHMRWCFAAKKEDVSIEVSRRDGTANSCFACREYARTALRQRGFLVGMKCDVPGEARWSPDGNAHFKWCMSITFNTYLPNFNLSGMLSGEEQAREQQKAFCALSNAEKYEKTGKTSSGLTKSTTPARKLLGQSPKPVGKSSTQVNTVVADPCKPGAPCKRSKMINPGILDTEQGFARQAPSATGTPIPSAPAASSPGISVFKE